MQTATIQVHLPKTNWLLRVASWFRRTRYPVRIPSRWEEVPRHLLPDVFTALAMGANDAQKIVGVLQVLLGLPKWVFFRLPPEIIANALRPCVFWILEETTPRLLGTVQINGRNWLLPGAAGRDMTVGQYLQVEQAMYLLRTSPDPSRLLACILRNDFPSIQQHIADTGMLPHLHTTQIDLHATALQDSHDVGMAWYVLEYWAAQRDVLRADFPQFFAPPSKAEKGKAPDWESIPARIAETGVFGNVAQTLATPLRTYLAWANAKAEENKPPSLQDLIKANHQKFLA